MIAQNKSSSKLEEAEKALRRYDLRSLSAACGLYAYAALDAEHVARALAGWGEARAHLAWQRKIRGQSWQQEAESALQLATTSVDRDAGSAHGHRAMAAALMLSPDQHARRRQAAVRAVELDPRDASNWYERWKAFGSCIDDGAIRRTLELDPNHFAGIHDLGVALSEAGRHEQAIKLLSTALSLNPENTLARYNLATILARAGRDAESERELREAARRCPDDELVRSIYSRN